MGGSKVAGYAREEHFPRLFEYVDGLTGLVSMRLCNFLGSGVEDEQVLQQIPSLSS